jgi:transposase-like protein
VVNRLLVWPENSVFSEYQLHKWQEQLTKHQEAAFPGHGKRVQNKAAEIARLKKELESVKEERDILKKAAKYFAKESGLSTPLFMSIEIPIISVICVVC